MAAQKGSAVLIKTTVSGSLTTIGGLRSSSITLNDEMVDITNKDSSNNRTMLPQGGVQSMSISGSGVFTDTTAEQQLRTDFGGATFSTYNFIVPDLGTFAGTFQITSLEFAGEFNGEATYSVTLESSGAITFSAA
jgi:TP901-1 family phage major tail protein